jgi:glycosyltransferase involved in cell wall biosynthesis
MRSSDAQREASEHTRLRFLFALPGFHQENRGAEVALLSVADELSHSGCDVTVIGAGPQKGGVVYRYKQVKTFNRRKLERLPKFPPFRSETVWEDAFFAANLFRSYRPADYDFTVTCNFPFTHWALRRGGKHRPLHLFVTQNGDWPAFSNDGEFKHFDCDGLICTNPDFEERNRGRWNTALIPNGIDPARYTTVSGDRKGFGLPENVPIVLMVSALINSKRVLDGIRAVAALPHVHFAVAGDGPLREAVDALATKLLPGRFTHLTLTADQMPGLYRSVDTFLHMSLSESFGNVFVEAMASGLPIVGHNSSRLRWIVGNRDTLCDTETVSEVTEAITRALVIGVGKPDKRAKDFTWKNIAERYREFAVNLLARQEQT